jgi:MoaA/NifB/PqqE/SkfB family radical SAM enzyme/predicted dehydrogenase
MVPLFSQASAVHDRVAGTPGALSRALLAMRLAASAGLALAPEVPLLSPRLQDLEAVVRLAVRCVPSLARLRFYLPSSVQPSALAPALWAEQRPALARAVEACRALGVPVSLHEYDGVPLCALGHDPELAALYRFDPRRPARARDGFSKEAPCEGCAVGPWCLGVARAYQAAHGGRDLVPFTSRPRGLFEQRTTPRRTWTEAQRKEASRAMLRVLRPTIHCNQDCAFCSANETTENLATSPAEMLRKIARVARQGVEHVSFSGGEPTLSKDLVHYVRAASRLGIRKVELVTNGVLLDTPERLSPLVEAGLNRAFVSLHAHDEDLSRRMTSKSGDWARTVRALGLLVEAGVWTDVNHVVTAVNYAYLPRFAAFVADTWGGRVGVSFAFVAPQFKALENASLVPRLSLVAPYLRRALGTLIARRVRAVVGSRQGVPPCVLGPYVGWSDALDMAPHAHAEDAPQKVRGPRCDGCRYTQQCVGLWRPYAARYGFDELEPLPGAPFTEDELRAIERSSKPYLSFEDLPEALRPMALPSLEPLPEPLREAPRRGLPVVSSRGAPPLRVALLGSGPQAQRILRGLGEAGGFVLVGVSSPHLLEREPGVFEGLLRGASAEALLDQAKPEVVVVAAATVAHHALVSLAAARGLPVLVEKPLAQTRAQALELVALEASGAFVMVAHAMVFTPGVQALLEALGGAKLRRVQVLRRVPAGTEEALVAWARDGLYQLLLHLISLLGAVSGSCAWTVRSVEARGEPRPEGLRAELVGEGGLEVALVVDFQAPAALVELSVEESSGVRRAWRRDADGAEALVRWTASGERAFSPERGNDTARMLAAFAGAVRRKAPSPVPARLGQEAMATAQAVVDALEPQLRRPNAPRHAASPELRLRG